MELHQLECFCEIVEQGKITLAAAKLNMAQPSLSQLLRKLEEELCVKLVERLPRGIRLTRQGERFYKYALDALRRDSNIRRELIQMEGGPSGDIYINCNATSSLITLLFLDFQKLYPGVTMRMNRPTTRQHDERQADLYITNELMPDRDMESITLATEDLVIAVPASHPLAKKRSVRLEELADENFLGVERRQSQHIFEGYCAAVGFRPKIVLDCPDTVILQSLLVQGLGIAAMPASWQKQCGPNVALLPISYPKCQRVIRLCWDKSAYISPAAALFKDYIIAHYNERFHANLEFAFN